ncbi:MAG: hypothetical protein ABI064_03230, partial [Acidobacteriaceae bacterium]
MSIAGMTSVFGLSAAIIWGVADFSGGIAARHLRVFWMLAISHGFSLLCLLALAGGLHLSMPGMHILILGFWSGLAGGIALLAFYHALSLGEMGITAALTGLLTAALPVVFTLLTIGQPSRRQLAGFALAALAIWLISTHAKTPQNRRSGIRSPSQRLPLQVKQREVKESPFSSHPGIDRRADTLKKTRTILAVIAGLGFGTFLIFIRQANGGGLVWPLAASRIGSLILAVGGGILFSRHHFIADAGPKTRPPSWQIGVLLALLASACD